MIAILLVLFVLLVLSMALNAWAAVIMRAQLADFARLECKARSVAAELREHIDGDPRNNEVASLRLRKGAP